jgi:hypothetical protein
MRKTLILFFACSIAIILATERSRACDSTNSQNPNVAEYSFNASTNSWQLVASWYDPVYNYYTPDPDDYTFTIGSPQDPAGPGGG